MAGTLNLLTCSISEAIRATGLSRTTLYNKMADGQLRSVKVGTRRLINAASLRALVGANDNAGGEND
jgi:excisionase family DNA binding protein